MSWIDKITLPCEAASDDGNFAIRADWNPETRRVESLKIEATGDRAIDEAVLKEVARDIDELIAGTAKWEWTGGGSSDDV